MRTAVLDSPNSVLECDLAGLSVALQEHPSATVLASGWYRSVFAMP